MSGPIKISELKAKARKVKKRAAASSGKEAYRFVSENLGGSPLDRIGRVALGILVEAGRKVSDVWSVSQAPESDRERYKELRRKWLRKRLERMLKK